MRYSDYNQFRHGKIKEVEGGYDFIYAPQENPKSDEGETVTVPLSDLAVRIAARHAFDLPNPSSNQKMNKALKGWRKWPD